MLILLTPVYFLLLMRETTPVNMTSHVSEIIEVHSNILVDLLVVLAKVFDTVAPSSPWGVVCRRGAGR